MDTLTARDFAASLMARPDGCYVLTAYGRPVRWVTVSRSAPVAVTSPAPEPPALAPVAPVDAVGFDDAAGVGRIAPAAALDAPAPEVPAAPVPAPAETAAAKFARLLAAGRRDKAAEPPEALAPDSPAPDAAAVASDDPPYPVPPAVFHRAGPDFRRAWVAKNWPELAGLGEEADTAVLDRLAEIKARG